jgi:opacity protein-like surface antigen
MKRVSTSLICVLWFASALAGAAELRTTIETATSYNSNIYSLNETDEVDDIILRLGPEFELRNDSEQRFDYRLNYRGWYQWYAEENAANDFQHRQRLRLGYDFTPRTRLSLDQRFRRVSNLQFDRDDFQAGDTGIDIRQNRYDRTDVALDLEHQLGRRWTFNAVLDYQTVDFENNASRSDNDTIGLTGSLAYTLSERHDLGFGLRVANQDFYATPTRLAAESDFLGLVVLWNFRITNRIELRFEGGPTRVETEQNPRNSARATEYVGVRFDGDLFRANYDACTPGDGQIQPIASNCFYNNPAAPPIPAEDLGDRQSYPLDFTDTDLNEESTEFFGRLALTVGLSDWQVEAGIGRRPSGISGQSLTNMIDEISLSVDYDPAGSRWRTYGELRFEQRQALTRALEIDYTLLPEVDDSALRDDAFLNETGNRGDQDSYAFLIGGSYAFNRNLFTSLEGRYRVVERVSNASGSTDSDTFIIELALRYEFAPERF